MEWNFFRTSVWARWIDRSFEEIEMIEVEWSLYVYKIFRNGAMYVRKIIGFYRIGGISWN